MLKYLFLLCLLVLEFLVFLLADFLTLLLLLDRLIAGTRFITLFR